MNYESIESLAGDLGAAMVVVTLVLIGQSALLMPLYVIRINGRLKKLLALQQAQIDELRALRGTLSRPAGTVIRRE